MESKGVLYLVATPIGNLDDITYRAVSTLKQVDAIISEDTRRSKKLLDEYGISTPLTSSYYQGAEGRISSFVERLLEGEDLALISDAGTPLISDPGFKLVSRAKSEGVKVVSLPGPTALVSALVVSGQPSDSFIFDGMLPKGVEKKRRYFESLQDQPRTVILYESPHRIEETLDLLDDVLPDRELTLCRELTKLHEETIIGTPAELLEGLEKGESGPRGEFTLVMRGATDQEIRAHKQGRFSDLSYQEQYRALTEIRNMSRKEALKKMAELRGLSKREVYDRLEREKSEED